MNTNHPKSVDGGQDAAAGSEELRSPGDTELGHIVAHLEGRELAGQSDCQSLRASSKKVAGMNNTHHTRSSDVIEANPNLPSLVAGGAGRGSGSVHRLMQSGTGSHLCQSGNGLPSEIKMNKRAVLNTG